MTAQDGAPRAIRVLLAAGEPERERTLLLMLSAQGIEVAARCLDGDSLVARAAATQADVALVASDLHRLRPETTAALAARSIPSVLVLASGDDAARFPDEPYVVAGGDVADIGAAVERAATGGVAHQQPESVDVCAGSTGSSGELVAVTSGKGAPGVTTIAIALAALSAQSTSTALLDLDLRGGDAGAYLDLDPRQGLATSLAARGPDIALDLPMQRTAHMQVLVGVERPELARGISPLDLLALAVALRDRAARAVVDAGVADAGSGTSEVLRAADRVLLVTGAGLVPLWRTQLAVASLCEGAGVERERLALVVNRREGRDHYDAEQIASALGVPVAGVVREDRAGARRAVAEHQPLSATRGPAARDLRDLAEELFDTRPAPSRRFDALRPPWPRIGRPRASRVGVHQVGEEVAT